MSNGDSSFEMEKEFENRTFLGIRTHPADDLSGPLPSQYKSWVSPDIHLIQPSGSRASKAITGSKNEIQVVVTNKGGIEAVDAKVDTFFADPSTASTPATATKIGSKYVTVPAHQQQSVSFSWTPSPSESGHQCLLSRVGIFAPPDIYQNPNKFEVRKDRHVAQKNIHVVTVSEPKMAEFGFGVVNPRAESMTFRVQARQIQNVQELDAIATSIDCTFARFGEADLQNVTLTLGNEQVLPSDFLPPDVGNFGNMFDPDVLPERPIRVENTGELGDPAVDELGNSFSVDLEPGEVHQATVQIGASSEASAGELYPVEVTQTDEEERPVGGLVVVLGVTEE